MFRYHEIRASSFCKLFKSFSSSTSIVNIQNHDSYCFLWSILAHNYKVDNHGENVSHYKKHFHEINQGDIPFPMRKKDIPTFERLNNLSIKVFELSAYDKTFPSKYVYKNYYDEQIDPLLHEIHYCFLTIFITFVGRNNTINTCAEDIQKHMETKQNLKNTS